MRIHPIAVLAALLAVAPTALAQGPTAMLRGTVTDSAHGRPLVGATVLVTRNSPEPAAWYSAITDDRGRFRLDTLAPGRYSAALWHPTLDSLGLTLPSRAIDIADGQRATMDLWIPSGATLRAASCPGVMMPQGAGVLQGQVMDADSGGERPLANAVVAVRWNDLTINRETLKVEGGEHALGAPTNAEGRYRFCGLPTDTWLHVQVQKGDAGGVVVRTSIGDTLGVAVLDLSLSAASARSLAAAEDTAVPPPPRVLSGTASVTGTVRGEGGQPMADVELRVAETAATTRSNAAGRFTLNALPAGTQLLEARRVGYRIVQQPVQLVGGREAAAEVTLRRIVSLDSVLVVARRSRYREFERNRRGGWGRFLDQEAIDKRHAIHTTDLVRPLPGFRISGSGPGARVYGSRSHGSLSGSGCETNIVIDGMQHMESFGSGINWMSPSDIGAIEAYAGPAGAPMQYDSACGVIVIWTKR